MIRVLIAEDQSMVRGALVALLRREQDIDIVAEAMRGDEVVPLAVKNLPDIALLDIEMPVMTGIDIIPLLRAALPSCKILILTTFGRPGYLRRALENGASGFMVKDAPAAQLATAIRRVIAGERVIDPNLVVSALSEGDNPLTERERDVLRLVQQGFCNAEIAASLALTEGTVRNYLSTSMQKLGSHTRVGAAILAEQKGWL